MLNCHSPQKLYSFPAQRTLSQLPTAKKIRQVLQSARSCLEDMDKAVEELQGKSAEPPEQNEKGMSPRKSRKRGRSAKEHEQVEVAPKAAPKSMLEEESFVGMLMSAVLLPVKLPKLPLLLKAAAEGREYTENVSQCLLLANRPVSIGKLDELMETAGVCPLFDFLYISTVNYHRSPLRFGCFFLLKRITPESVGVRTKAAGRVERLRQRALAWQTGAQELLKTDPRDSESEAAGAGTHVEQLQEILEEAREVQAKIERIGVSGLPEIDVMDSIVSRLECLLDALKMLDGQSERQSATQAEAVVEAMEEDGEQENDKPCLDLASFKQLGAELIAAVSNAPEEATSTQLERCLSVSLNANLTRVRRVIQEADELQRQAKSAMQAPTAVSFLEAWLERAQRNPVALDVEHRAVSELMQQYKQWQGQVLAELPSDAEESQGVVRTVQALKALIALARAGLEHGRVDVRATPIFEALVKHAQHVNQVLEATTSACELCTKTHSAWTMATAKAQPSCSADLRAMTTLQQKLQSLGLHQSAQGIATARWAWRLAVREECRTGLMIGRLVQLASRIKHLNAMNVDAPDADTQAFAARQQASWGACKERRQIESMVKVARKCQRDARQLLSRAKQGNKPVDTLELLVALKAAEQSPVHVPEIARLQELQQASAALELKAAELLARCRSADDTVCRSEFFQVLEECRAVGVTSLHCERLEALQASVDVTDLSMELLFSPRPKDMSLSHFFETILGRDPDVLSSAATSSSAAADAPSGEAAPEASTPAADAADEEEAGDGEEEDEGGLYCICQEPYNSRRLMLGCDKCDQWFHASCVNVSKAQAKESKEFTCPACADYLGVPYAFRAVVHSVPTPSLLSVAFVVNRAHEMRAAHGRVVSAEYDQLEKVLELVSRRQTCFIERIAQAMGGPVAAARLGGPQHDFSWVDAFSQTFGVRDNLAWARSWLVWCRKSQQLLTSSEPPSEQALMKHIAAVPITKVAPPDAVELALLQALGGGLTQLLENTGNALLRALAQKMPSQEAVAQSLANRAKLLQKQHTQRQQMQADVTQKLNSMPVPPIPVAAMMPPKAEPAPVKKQEEAPAADDEVQELFCLCRTPYQEGDFMLACDGCDGWFHPRCIGLMGPALEQAQAADSWRCSQCR